MVGFEYDRNLVLGKGGFGAVFRGHFNGEDVAVKRILEDSSLKTSCGDSREEMAMLSLNHPNVVKLLHSESDDNFR